jgi:hypothetical protein
VPYLVVIADVVRSRSARSRGELQRSLAAAVARVNASARRRLASPCTITLGDEFQAVYRSPDGLFGDFWTLFEALHPVALRFAVGLGEITTPINRKQALGMDGPSFYRARRAMEALKRESESVIRVDGGDADLALANHALRLACRLLARWKRPVLSTLVCLAGRLSVEETARRAGVTPRAIFKRISANSLREILAIAGAVESQLATALGGGDER